MAAKKPEPVPMIIVPAPLLTRACQLLGELPAKHAAEVYVELRACEVVEDAESEKAAT